jgi:NitT/TauT family transport system substrate-binding protein
MTRVVRTIIFAGLLILSACTPVTSTPEAPVATEPAAPGVTPTFETVHLKVGLLNYISFAPLFIALDEGYFAEQGLEVEFVDFGSTTTEITPALLQRQLDVGTSTMSTQVLNAVIDEGQIRYVADKGYVNPDASCVSDAWVGSSAALDSGSLTDYSSLSGKKVVAPQGNVFEYAFDLMLQDAGLTRDDIEFVDIRDNPTRLEALGQGSIDVSVLGEPWISRAVSADAGEVWVPYSEVIPGYAVAAITFGPSILEDNPEAGVRFMIAYIKAIRQFNEGKTDRNIEILSKYTQMTPEELNAICWTSFREDGSIDVQALEAFNQWALDKGYVSEFLPADRVWDPQFVEAALAALGE